jgi:hypothetical protein
MFINSKTRIKPSLFFVSKLDNLVKKFPDKIEKIEQAKKDISKILKSLEK